MAHRRVILITGATGGVGAAIARRFARAGHRIVIHYFRNKEGADELTAEVTRYGAEAEAFQADVRSLAEMQAMIRFAVNRWNRLDVLVAAAGVRKDGLLLRTTDQDWDSVLDTNLKGVWNSLMAVRDPFMHQRDGRMVVIGSIAGFQGRAGQANYAASKAGLVGLIRSVAVEWASHRVQINLVMPGLQFTGMTAGLSRKQSDALASRGVLQESPPLEQVADFVYLLTNMTGVSGQIFNLDSRFL